MVEEALLAVLVGPDVLPARVVDEPLELVVPWEPPAPPGDESSPHPTKAIAPSVASAQPRPGWRIFVIVIAPLGALRIAIRSYGSREPMETRIGPGVAQLPAALLSQWCAPPLLITQAAPLADDRPLAARERYLDPSAHIRYLLPMRRHLSTLYRWRLGVLALVHWM